MFIFQVSFSISLTYMYKMGALYTCLITKHAALLAVPICVVVQILSSFWVRTEILLVQIRKSMNGPCEESLSWLLLSLEPSVLSIGSKIFVKACVTYGGL